MDGLPLVCYSTGTVNSLLDKLAKLRNHSNPTEEFSNLTENFKKAVRSLKEDFCDKLGVPTVCMKQVRELVFEIEDWINQKAKTDMLDSSDTKEIQYFMTEISEVHERFTWYGDLFKEVLTEPGLDVVAPSNITINPRLPVEEKSFPGILEGPRDKIVKHLTEDKEGMRKVVSIVGMEGLGKTTLAKEIYSELQLRRQFECQAFVSAGRRPAMREILNDILRQVKPWSAKLSSYEKAKDVEEIITELQEYFGTKRYFIVVDGIWTIWAWKVINCALPNNLGSRVLITTCIKDVGKSCSIYRSDLVYEMEALSKKNSEILFLRSIARRGERVSDFEEVCGNMLLDMCDGMPLAIIVAANLLARKSEERTELKMLGKSIISSMKQYSPTKGMTNILHMSFADLSLPLRSCFLYLGLIPQDYTIKKDRLIRLWGAEGFIPRTNRECLWATGERFFNELISRRLIQPVFDYTDDQAFGCTIHGVILDFIRSMSREENFATRAAELCFGPFPCDTIRRLSLDSSNEDEVVTFSASTPHLSRMRSLIFFEDINDEEEMHVPLSIRASVDILWGFKLLQVLDLEDRKGLEDHHLAGIGELVQLRYLGLAGTGIRGLPEEIGELEQLETLDLRRNWYFGTTLPASIFKLQKLKHLLLFLLDVDVERIRVMHELEEASSFASGSNSLGMVVQLLRESECLRILDVRLGASPVTNLMYFFDEVVKSKLQSLSLNCEDFDDEEVSLLVDSWVEVTAPPENKFDPPRFELVLLDLPLGRVPPNMGSLSSLTHLHIQLEQAKAEDFQVLGGLINLVLLNMVAKSCFLEGSRFIIKKGTFLHLKVFSFIIRDSWMGLEFKEGAMPQLQRLWRTLVVITARDRFEYLDIGIEHLTCTTVHVMINCTNATYSQVDAAEAAIRAKISEPVLVLSRINETCMKDEGQLSIHQDEGHSLDLHKDDDDKMWKAWEKIGISSLQSIREKRVLPSVFL
ncbi:hypothetical protein CFC21_004756 [Triticum aestivum]|uniref:NB-ARC domain-containing protein n=2 Tax=Triticum aestivum TaxID=4565 RepID=A0A9R1D887_WHEAT|nr:hypothetical protein CFC21_004756 [Triticum aestivum]